MKDLSIKAKLLLISLGAVVTVSVLVAFLSIYTINDLSQKDIANFRKDAYENKEKELQNYVSLAMKTVESYYARTAIDKVKLEVQEDLKHQAGFLFSILDAEYKRLKGTVSEAELKLKLKKIVEGTRYGKTGYFWINDTDAVIVMHPIKPALNGKNLVNYKDKGGKRIFFEFAKAAKAGGDGFVDYVWPKPGFDKPQPKVSYVKLFKPFNWVIGTGEYVDDVSETLKQEALTAVKNMRYGKTGYFWINDSFPKMVMHPIKPALDGKDLSKVKDKAGKLLFNEMSRVSNASKEGGLVKYMWEKPGKDVPQQKFSFVQRFPQWDWIIGTGEYVDDVEASILVMEENTKEEIEMIIYSISVFTLVCVLLIYFIYSIAVRKVIVKPIEELSRAVDYLGTGEDKRKEIRKVNDDEIGKLVDSFNGYIKKLKDAYEEDEKVIAEVEDVIQKVNNGFYVYKVEKDSKNPLVQKLKNSINVMIDGTDQKLKSINDTLLEYGNSNFDYKPNLSDSSSNGIIGSIFTSSQQLGGTVSEFLSMITTSGEKLNKDTDVLSSSASSLSSSANDQAASLEETAAAVEEITSIIKSSNEKVNRMSVLANDLNSSAKDGQELANKTTKAMEDIDTQVKSINDAITVIDQIAFQTNILSLNAAVEAATAGEAGKGFAVVAQEVRNLASRSAEAAKEIKDIVEAATNKANEGKLISDEMIGGYSELNNKIGETIDLISDVTDASKEQETGIIQINDVVNSLDQATQVNASSATQISSLAQEVSCLSSNLLAIADRAKFNQDKKAEICDIDLVFAMSKLKNDHIIFKNKNFANVGSFTSWTVPTCNDCDFGKWINEQEQEGKSYTRSSNWSAMKEQHEKVHKSVQDYISKNAAKVANNELETISKDIESATNTLFALMDKVKVEHCKDFKPVEEKKEETCVTLNDKPQVNTSSKNSVKEMRKPEKVEVVKPTNSAQTITANNDDDDEWESF